MNPFIFGEAVTKEHFINRKKEIAELTKDLLDCQKMFLISPRRFGKTSLLKKVSSHLASEGVKVAYIDLFKSSSLEQFTSSIAHSLSAIKSTTIEETVKFMKEFILGLRPQFNIEPDGSFSFTVDSSPSKRETLQILEGLLDYPQKLALRDKAKIVVIYDEFQEIVNFGGESLEKFIRSIVQHHRNVGYVFSGSKKDMMIEMTTKRSRAFYGIGPTMFLDKIDNSIWFDYIKAIFKKGGFYLDPGVPEQIILYTSNVPYYIQYLCHEIWDIYSEEKRVKLDDVEKTIMSIINNNTPTYQTLWDILPATQRRVLQGLANLVEKNIFSQQFMIKYQLKSPSLIKKSVDLLVKKDILERENGNYVFTDIWFAFWVKKMFSTMTFDFTT